MKEGKQAFDEVIASLKKLAYEKYSQGGDRMIECWEEDDYLLFIVECAMHCRSPFTVAEEYFKLWDEQRKAAQIWADEGPWE
jgi:hypothetical protein